MGNVNSSAGKEGHPGRVAHYVRISNEGQKKSNSTRDRCRRLDERPLLRSFEPGKAGSGATWSSWGLVPREEPVNPGDCEH